MHFAVATIDSRKRNESKNYGRGSGGLARQNTNNFYNGNPNRSSAFFKYDLNRNSQLNQERNPRFTKYIIAKSPTESIDYNYLRKTKNPILIFCKKCNEKLISETSRNKTSFQYACCILLFLFTVIFFWVPFICDLCYEYEHRCSKCKLVFKPDTFGEDKEMKDIQNINNNKNNGNSNEDSNIAIHNNKDENNQIDIHNSNKDCEEQAQQRIVQFI